MATEKRSGWPIFEVWKEYEQIAMHFNDLLMKLRMQALAGVTAVSTFVGLFAETESNAEGWGIAAFAFLILAAFWTAIWLIDSLYYNRLLLGAAKTLFEIEELSKTQDTVDQINLSSNLNMAVSKRPDKRTARWNQKRGRIWFYSIVLLVLLIGFAYSVYQTGSLEGLSIFCRTPGN